VVAVAASTGHPAHAGATYDRARSQGTPTRRPARQREARRREAWAATTADHPISPDHGGEPLRLVVAGVDGGNRSVPILRWAAYEALRLDAMLVVVHAYGSRVHRAPYAPAHIPLAPDSATAHAIRRLEDCVHTAFDGHPPVPVHTICDNRQPVPALLDYATGAAMLVLGSRGTAPGPIARDCLRAAHCPVVLLPAAATPGDIPADTHARR
jgi:nucleotide-binding universal stress UspA family protein